MSEQEGPKKLEITGKTREASNNEVEKMEEAKMRAKFPMVGNKPLSGHSAFLQKRLAKGQKFFDSGDYNMARQKQAPRSTPTAVPVYGTGETIPTPETVPVRKTSIIQPKYPSNAI
ncbi:hypothetical protein RUM43_014663 [Polyplax serrata]|uniref:Alpha-endosulfine n=1 Tax=Polyplax serrata TaxID=468196 RepID=A0AAN8S6T7_POLSC